MNVLEEIFKIVSRKDLGDGSTEFQIESIDPPKVSLVVTLADSESEKFLQAAVRAPELYRVATRAVYAWEHGYDKEMLELIPEYQELKKLLSQIEQEVGGDG